MPSTKHSLFLLPSISKAVLVTHLNHFYTKSYIKQHKVKTTKDLLGKISTTSLTKNRLYYIGFSMHSRVRQPAIIAAHLEPRLRQLRIPECLPLPNATFFTPRTGKRQCVTPGIHDQAHPLRRVPHVRKQVMRSQARAQRHPIVRQPPGSKQPAGWTSTQLGVSLD